MSVSGQYQGGLQSPVPVRLTTTGQTVVFTATDKDTTVAAFSLANETGSAVVANVYLKRSGTSYLVWRGSIAASGATVVADMPLRLRDADTFEVTAASGNALTVTPIIIRSHANVAAATGQAALTGQAAFIGRRTGT